MGLVGCLIVFILVRRENLVIRVREISMIPDQILMNFLKFWQIKPR